MNAHRAPSIERPRFVPLAEHVVTTHDCKNETHRCGIARNGVRDLGGSVGSANAMEHNAESNRALCPAVGEILACGLRPYPSPSATGGATDETSSSLFRLASSVNHWIAGALENLADPTSGSTALAAEYIRQAEAEIVQLRERLNALGGLA